MCWTATCSPLPRSAFNDLLKLSLSHSRGTGMTISRVLPQSHNPRFHSLNNQMTTTGCHRQNPSSAPDRAGGLYSLRAVRLCTPASSSASSSARAQRIDIQMPLRKMVLIAQHLLCISPLFSLNYKGRLRTFNFTNDKSECYQKSKPNDPRSQS